MRFSCAEPITITDDDVDYLRGSHSRLSVGTALARDALLRLALMASENRAAAALSRSYPRGREGFVQAMNLPLHERLTRWSGVLRRRAGDWRFILMHVSEPVG